MKISPIASPAATTGNEPAQESVSQQIRAMKMNVNQTPEQRPLQPPAAEELPITDNSEPVSPVEETQPISPQFAALARQKRSLQVKERELADREKALAEKTAQGSAGIDLARLKSDPLGVLQEAGVSYDDLTQAILANPVNAETAALKAELKALKEGVDQRFTEQNIQAEQQVLTQMKKDAEQIVAQDDSYELVRATKSVPDVIKLIERTYKETGEVLDVTDALKMVEDHLFDKHQKLLNLKKMQGLIKQPEPAPAQQPRQQGMRTLANKDTASVPMTGKQRALAAFYGTLKK